MIPEYLKTDGRKEAMTNGLLGRRLLRFGSDWRGAHHDIEILFDRSLPRDAVIGVGDNEVQVPRGVGIKVGVLRMRVNDDWKKAGFSRMAVILKIQTINGSIEIDRNSLLEPQYRIFIRRPDSYAEDGIHIPELNAAIYPSMLVHVREQDLRKFQLGKALKMRFF